MILMLVVFICIYIYIYGWELRGWKVEEGGGS